MRRTLLASVLWMSILLCKCSSGSIQSEQSLQQSSRSHALYRRQRWHDDDDDWDEDEDYNYEDEEDDYDEDEDEDDWEDDEDDEEEPETVTIVKRPAAVTKLRTTTATQHQTRTIAVSPTISLAQPSSTSLSPPSSTITSAAVVPNTVTEVGGPVFAGNASVRPPAATSATDLATTTMLSSSATSSPAQAVGHKSAVFSVTIADFPASSAIPRMSISELGRLSFIFVLLVCLGALY